jgi:hypothetical protein
VDPVFSIAQIHRAGAERIGLATSHEPGQVRLARLMQTAKSESVRLNAAEAILSRGWGRSVQAFQIDSQFAAKKLNELSESELAQFEAWLADADVEPRSLELAT